MTAAAAAPTVPEIDVQTLVSWLEAGTAVVIDVREDEEWEEWRLPAAVLLPMSEFEPEQLPDRAGKRLVIQCRSGVRSAAVTRRLVEREGFTEVYNLAGGIIAWKEAGLPVLTGTAPGTARERAA